MKLQNISIYILLFIGLTYCSSPYQQEADKFVVKYNKEFQKVWTAAEGSNWYANIDINKDNSKRRVEANNAMYAFVGKKETVNKAKELLKHSKDLDAITVKQLKVILYKAAHGPGTIPAVVDKLVKAEAKQNDDLYSFEFKYDGKKISANEIDNRLRSETSLKKRRELWEASKEVGIVLKDGLADLQMLRNKVAKEMGYSSFFDLETADYGMNADEMRELMQQVYEQLQPLYAQLYTWAKYRLAAKYHTKVPEKMPAHWLPNRWSQEWDDLVEGISMDELFKDKTSEWIIKQGEKFYVSMGFPELPQTFWERSSLYPLPEGSIKKKNSHASAWHIDLDQDVRSLMSIENNYKWFGTAHHELGHIYYYLSYSNPDVPIILREGANRGFHEGIGELITIASSQTPYLKEIGLLSSDAKIDKIKWLLNEALQNVVFIPWAAGVMTNFEYDLYENDLPKDEYNKKWWELVEKYQGIVPPANRGEEFCDAATKTHINNDPAQYYDYAVAKLLQYQFHDYISRNILKTDPQNANYYNNKEVGKYLKSILSVGAVKDWRKLLKEKTGEGLSARAMQDYFSPLMEYLKNENKGRKIIQF